MQMRAKDVASRKLFSRTIIPLKKFQALREIRMHSIFNYVINSNIIKYVMHSDHSHSLEFLPLVRHILPNLHIVGIWSKGRMQVISMHSVFNYVTIYDMIKHSNAKRWNTPTQQQIVIEKRIWKTNF